MSRLGEALLRAEMAGECNTPIDVPHESCTPPEEIERTADALTADGSTSLTVGPELRRRADERTADERTADEGTAEERTTEERIADEPVAAPPSSPWQFDAALPRTERPDVEAAPDAAVDADADADADDRWLTYKFGALADGKVVVEPKVESCLVEQYRRVAATLHHAQLQRDVRTIMVTSALASEGKTLTATNLALTLSHSYKRRVLLIDADLRRPTVHEVFRIDNSSGLSEVLSNPAARRLPLVRLSPTLSVLTGGRPEADPMSGLASEEMKMLLAEATEHFDWIVVDTPPIVVLSDANLLASKVDGTILVIGANATPYPLVKRAIESIGPQRILGVVLNRIERSQMVGGYGYYNYYGYGRPAGDQTIDRAPAQEGQTRSAS